MDTTWTLSELVGEVEARLQQLPPPKNGQVRAVPDDRTIRYYGTIGLLDRPVAMRGRTALYGIRHLAQVVAIKRLQTAGRSLAEIQALWPELDDETLARMSGVALGRSKSKPRGDFWKQAPAVTTQAPASIAPAAAPIELRIELALGAVLTLAMPPGRGVALTPADLRALRAAAAPLVSELARRQLAAHAEEEES